MGFSFGGNRQKQSEQTNQNTTQSYTPDAGFLALLNPALGNASRLMGQGYQSVTPEQIQGFQNPYQQGVIDNTTSQIRRQGDIAANDINAQAAAAGAFGGSGWGLLRGENERAVSDAVGTTSANLNSQSYSQALAAAMAENQNRASFDINSLGAYGSLLGLLNGWGTTTGNMSGTANRTGSGFNWGVTGKYGG